MENNVNLKNLNNRQQRKSEKQNGTEKDIYKTAGSNIVGLTGC